MAIDYRSFEKDGDGTENEAHNKRWWLVDEDVPEPEQDKQMAQSIAFVLSQIDEFDGPRQQQYQISGRLYGNSDILGINGMAGAKTTSRQPTTLKDRISYNVIQSTTDTITAKISKNRPKPLFLTSGGMWKIQRRAKKLTKFVEGVFYENEMPKMGPMAFRDSSIIGDGIIHVFERFGRVAYERVMASELKVDFVDGFYGKPRQMHRVKNVDRDTMIELFPEHKDAIIACNGAVTNLSGIPQNVSDQITVAESWHLPSGPNAKDGLHVISIKDHLLFKEVYEDDFFPFAILSWSKRLCGFWSQSGAEQIQNIQLEINKILWVIQRSFHLAGTFRIWLKNGSKIVKEHLTNDLGLVITGDEAPQYLIPPIVQPEIYSHLQTLKNAAYEQYGISQLSTSSQKPAGLNSGKALREYNDIETERFMTVGQAYENFHLDLAKLTVSTARKIYKKDKKLSVKVPGKKFIETIQWKDVDLSEDQYVMKCFPISSLPSDPSGRLQTVQEYVQAGFYTQRQAKKLLETPDTEAEDSLQSANEDYLNKILEEMTDEDDTKYTPPSPDDDLNLALELSNEYLAMGKRDMLPEALMENLRTFNAQVILLQQKAATPPMPPQPGGAAPGAPPPGVTQAVPAAPPVSDLMPRAG